MLMGEYDKTISIGQPEVFGQSDLEALTVEDDANDLDYGLDMGLGVVLDDIERFYTAMGLDGMGEIGFVHKKLKKSFKKVTKKIQRKIKKDFKKIEKMRRKITPKALIKMENKVLKRVNKIKSKADRLRSKITPGFLKRFERKIGFKVPGMGMQIRRNLASGLISQVNIPLEKAAMKVSSKITPSFVRKMNAKIARSSPRRLVGSRLKYTRWLKKTNPMLFKVVTAEADIRDKIQQKYMSKTRGLYGPNEIMGLGEEDTTESTPGFWDNLVSAAKTIIPTYIAAKQQRDIYKMQMARAERGLPPLNAAQVAPVIRTQIDMGPQMTQGIKKMIIPLGIGAAALGVFFMMKK